MTIFTRIINGEILLTGLQKMNFSWLFWILIH